MGSRTSQASSSKARSAADGVGLEAVDAFCFLAEDDDDEDLGVLVRAVPILVNSEASIVLGAEVLALGLVSV